ncbi:MAG: hypothetical protein ACMG6S_21805 [Byssovorax sp.]
MSKPRRLDHEDLRRRLEAASGTAGLVRIARLRLEEKTAFSVGYLVGVGERFILLHHLDDGFDLDGYQALRIKHITGLETDFSRKAFYERALELKHESARAPERIVLDSAPELLRSIDERFPLLVIHREAIYLDECEVGRIRALFKKQYLLHWINPNATWEVDNRYFRYADVTRVEFAGRYLGTLALVSGAMAGMVFPAPGDPTPLG